MDLEDFLEEHGLGILTFIFIILPIFIIYLGYKMETGLFEYVDYNNNNGLAKSCSKKYGNLTCTTINGKEIAVISYKKIN